MRLTVFDTPPDDAVTIAPVAAVHVPAFALKVAELDPDATDTDAGTVTIPLSDETATAMPEGAAALSDIVQVVDAPDARLLAPQLTAERLAEGATTGAVSEIETLFDTPL
jgi:hypothetical protein